MEHQPQIEMRPLQSLIPYANNSRTHDDKQVAQIAASIREFGFTNPVLIDDSNGIIAGHGRVLAARKLALDEVPCIRLSHLSETQRKAYVIADNKLALNAGWNEKTLALELSELRESNFDLSKIGFDADEIEAALNPESALSEKYSHKIEAPVYSPKGEKPELRALLDSSRHDELVASIDVAEIPKDVKWFLKQAATRHLVFDYEAIAEFYCHADAATQSLMEDSALVIIDFAKAMQRGYVKLSQDIQDVLKDSDEA